MYNQEFYRLKATYLNNLASCFFSVDEIEESDKFNDMALMEDPSYAKGYYRKCLILEAKGQYSGAINVAQGCIDEYSNEYEFDINNKNMIPKFE